MAQTRISEQQRIILRTLAASPARGWLPAGLARVSAFHQALPGFHSPLTASQRASLSRSLKRLHDQGLITHSNTLEYQLTGKGWELTAALGADRDGRTARR